ncbi:hypothetical protein H9P43_004433 [Blastocladiella emersonii ATCC 22665]|nr:hypothetical protein H9P43_004433 [Blastocladiella emersonii ATCC 22665]
MSPHPVTTRPASSGDLGTGNGASECPVAASPKSPKRGLIGSLLGRTASSSSLKGAKSPTQDVKSTAVVHKDAETAIHYTAATPAPEIRAQIAAKLNVAAADFHLVDDKQRIVNDFNAASLARFTRLWVVEGKPSTVPIVGPPGIPVFGNAAQVAPDFIGALQTFTRDYGKTFKMRIFDRVVHVTSDPDLVEAIIMESPYFTKRVIGVFSEIQAFSGRGLFTVDTADPKWGPAHKLLTPTFSSGSMKMYTPDMVDVTRKLVDCFDHLDGKTVSITEWMTRFTLETIGQCGFGYDFHLLDGPKAKLHPFVDAMNHCLNESKARSSHTRLYKMMPVERNYVFDKSVKLMQDTVDSVIQERKAKPDANKRDLLNFMLTSTTETGEPLDDENIRDQIVTFLIAGHETTSTLLSWTLWLLSQHPAVESKVLEEAIRVCGRDPAAPITQQQIGQLTYINQVLKESLRLYPPAPAVIKSCQTSTVLKGTPIHAGEGISVNVVGLHRSREVWGPNPDVFNPDHFTRENEAKRHMYAWVPFSFGERSCIGMTFAMQEAKIAIATLIRKFTFEYDGPVPPPYDPKALTLRPTDLRLTIHQRTALPELAELAATTSNLVKSQAPAHGSTSLLAMTNLEVKSMVVVYGSNMGTSEDFAHQVEGTAKRFKLPVSVVTLDAWVAAPIDKEAVHVFITSTYNGNPPDNAVAAAAWLKADPDAPGRDLTGLRYCVFGCGNSQWRTFQAFPRFVDDRLNAFGAERILALGAGDADVEIEDHFTAWQAGFWVAMQEHLAMAGITKEHPMLQSNPALAEARIEMLADAAGVAPVRPASHPATTLAVNRELLKPVPGVDGTDGKSTRHLEFALADDTPVKSYREGDHFEVWPENEPAAVAAVAKHLGVDLDAAFVITGDIANGKSPAGAVGANRKCTVRDVLTFFVDLNGPVQKLLAEAVLRAQGKADLAVEVRHKNADAFKAVTKQYPRAQDAILAAPGMSLLDVLTHATAVTPRRYSIASSEKAHPNRVSLCVGVAAGGLCSTFLQRATEGHAVHALIKPCNDTFHLPPAGSDTPIVMVCAGTGLSPFLGFLQERKARGDKSEAHLFYGCRHPDHDFIYARELQQYVDEGFLTKVHVAFSRFGEGKVKYVQHAIAAEGDMIVDLLHARKAQFYICGSAKGMARDVAAALVDVTGSKLGVDGKAYMAGLQANGQYIEDVWG